MNPTNRDVFWTACGAILALAVWGGSVVVVRARARSELARVDARHSAVAVGSASAPSSSTSEAAPVPTPPLAIDGELHDTDAAERVLFIGNNFLTNNDLPGTLATLATSAKKATPYVEAYANDAYTLTLDLADAQNPSTRLAGLLSLSGASAPPWSYVVVQEQSEIPGFDMGNDQRRQSMASVVALSQYLVARDAVPVLLMTWGYLHGDAYDRYDFPTYLVMQERLIRGYRDMARDIVASGAPASIAPVGLAFRRVFEADIAARRDPLVDGSLFSSLFAPDGKHPAPAGTYLAALVVTATIYRVDATTIWPNPMALTSERQTTLQRAAEDAVNEEDDATPY